MWSTQQQIVWVGCVYSNRNISKTWAEQAGDRTWCRNPTVEITGFGLQHSSWSLLSFQVDIFRLRPLCDKGLAGKVPQNVLSKQIGTFAWSHTAPLESFRRSLDFSACLKAADATSNISWDFKLPLRCQFISWVLVGQKSSCFKLL